MQPVRAARRLLVVLIAGVVFPAHGATSEAPATTLSASASTTAAATTTMPYITARDGDLYRGAERFRVFGVQNLEHRFERAFYTVGYPLHREGMAARVRAVRAFGANTLRIHLQLFDFVQRDEHGELSARERAFDNLDFLLRTAEREHLYLLVSGNNVWFADDVPAWYDALPNRERWEVQAFFFGELARRAADSPAVLAYELVSEPSLSYKPDEQWYRGSLAGYTFAQTMARGVDPEAGARTAREWIERLTAAIRNHDQRHLITFGAMGGYYDGPFGVSNTAPLLDLFSPHVYPRLNDPGYTRRVIARWTAAGLPVVVGETHLAHSSEAMFRAFIEEAAPQVDGIISFYYGTGDDTVPIDREHVVPFVLDLHTLNRRVFGSLRELVLEGGPLSPQVPERAAANTP